MPYRYNRPHYSQYKSAKIPSFRELDRAKRQKWGTINNVKAYLSRINGSAVLKDIVPDPDVVEEIWVSPEAEQQSASSPELSFAVKDQTIFYIHPLSRTYTVRLGLNHAYVLQITSHEDQVAPQSSYVTITKPSGETDTVRVGETLPVQIPETEDLFLLKYVLFSGGLTVLFLYRNTKPVPSSPVLEDRYWQTLTPTPQNTQTPTKTFHVTQTVSVTPSVTLSYTRTPTPTQTQTPTITLASGLTPTPTVTTTLTLTRTAALTPTITKTTTLTPTYTPTITRTVTPTITRTVTLTPSLTQTNTPTPTPTPAPPSACIEGWSYTNFQGATFRNGDPIPEITDQEAWNTATGPGWCYFDNDPANDAIYGKLYNRYAVADIRGLAPAGFHIPTLAEWVDLITCLGGSDAGGGIWPVAGAKMKTTGTIQDGDGLWNTPNVATNESLFSVEPAGCRTGGFINLHARGSFWVYDSDTCINFNNGASYVYIGGDSTGVGYSVRLKQGEMLSSTPTATPSMTPTATPTQTVTSTPTQTVTRTPTQTVTRTVTLSPQLTRTNTQTVTRTQEPTATPTLTPTPTVTPTVSVTTTPTLTPTPTVTPTVSVTATVTGTITPTVSVTRTPTQTATPTVSVTTTSTTTTAAVTPTASVTKTLTPTQTVSMTTTPTATPVNILVATGVVDVEVTTATSGGTTTYSISQFGTLNPTLTCYRGTNYDFIIKTPSHPFALRTVANDATTSVSGAYNNNVVTGNAGGIVMFTPNDSTPGTIVYQCGIHPAMVGIIIIRDY